MFERETGGRRHLDGVRRSERVEEEESRELTIIDTRSAEIGRRFEAEKSKKDRMWTEITKDLVSLEAIKEKGYEFEETEKYYYVMEYLRYVCLQLPCTLPFTLYNAQASSTFQSIFLKSTPLPCLILTPLPGRRPPPRRTNRRHQTGPPRTHPRDRSRARNGRTPAQTARPPSRTLG